MARRFAEHSRLLTRAFFLVLLYAALSAGDARAESGSSEPLKVVLFRSPDSPTIGGTLIVTLFVDHPRPSEVIVSAPLFPPSLVLERTRVEPRLLPGSSGTSERWTAVEYSFKPSEAGFHRIGAFGIRVGGKRTETAPFSIEIGGGMKPAVPKSLRWDGVPVTVRPGESVEIRLVSEGFVTDSAALPSVTAPENSILQSLPVSPDEFHSGTLARFSLTLLKAAPFSLPSVALRLPDGSSVSALSRSLSVVSESGEPVARQSAVSTSNNLANGSTSGFKPSFPDTASSPALFRNPLASVYDASRAAWDSGDYVSAMAILRGAERDSPLGLFVRRTRVEAEKSLLVSSSHDEPYAPFLPLAAIAASSMLVVLILGTILSFHILEKEPVTSRRRRRFIIVLVVASLGVLTGGRLLYAASRARQSVILSACRSLRVPDSASAPSAEFAAGQAARATSWTGTGSGAWLFVEADDGRSGWIKAAEARRY